MLRAMRKDDVTRDDRALFRSPRHNVGQIIKIQVQIVWAVKASPKRQVRQLAIQPQVDADIRTRLQGRKFIEKRALLAPGRWHDRQRLPGGQGGNTEMRTNPRAVAKLEASRAIILGDHSPNLSRE